ncbi:MAG: hypothetical protein DWB42_18815 [Chloroflexi bacterium]|nr:hypothetical protein [Chloroflexota bacterium]MDL1886169.1 hypothetical protein [Anaerolineae bacterium CFX8]
MTNKRAHFFKRRRLIGGLAGLIVLAAALALGWRGQGPVWNTLWWLTGEETALAQVRGLVEYLGNFIRPQPDTAPDVPIQHMDTSPYGINTFLQNEVEPAKRERQAQMIAEAGFKWIRQQFPWEDIEIHGRGDFEDRRNVDAVGIISAWDKYDNIVALAENYGLNILARLDNPPAWTHVQNPDIGSSAPPDDLQDFVNYAVAVAERYKGRLHYYQIWNEPNIYPEWGNQPVSPEAYTDLLCRTYNALKTVDPTIVVVSGPLSPTVSLAAENLNDFIFLQRMYDAGAGACFDVMSAQGYGFYSGPTDRRLRPMTLTYARHLYIRDIMAANGDAHKPIWLSEAAWNAQPEDPNIVQVQYGNFGIVTEEQAARYMPLAYRRAQEEWPWVGVIFYWFFKHEDDSRKNQAHYYFRMAEPDFTPLPVYDSMKTYITSQTPVLYPGVHQGESWRVQADGRLLAAPNAQFGTALETREARFTAEGTLVILRWRGAGEVLNVEIDGQNAAIGGHCTRPFGEGDWHETILCSALTPTRHTFRITPVVDEPFLLDAIIVADRTYQNIAPLAGGAAVLIGMLLFVIFSALRERRK